jgi:hypothetical protein
MRPCGCADTPARPDSGNRILSALLIVILSEQSESKDLGGGSIVAYPPAQILL